MSMLEVLNDRRKGLYISQEGLRNLAGYGYHGEDRSFFGNLILKHWWNWVVELCPLWFAPNLLTLLGLLCNVVGYVLIATYSPHLTEAVPRWICFVDAFLIFAYQTLDNVDGKQARRTGSSSPLGELFDHGCDSITMGMIALVTAAAVRLGGVLTLVGIIIGWGPFYLAHWEEYHTGILIMGKFNGPTEAQLIVIGMLLFTGIVGPWVWIHPLFHVHGTIISLNHFAFAFTIAFSLITIAQNFQKVLSLPSRAMALFPTLLQLLPFTILVAASGVWTGTEKHLFISHPHIVLMALSLVFGYMCSRLIVNRVCKESTQMFHGILALTVAVAVVGVINNIRGSHNGAVEIAYALLILSGIQFFFFSICVIQQLTTHLGIRAFKIVPVDPSTKRPPPPLVTTSSPLLEATHHEIHIDNPSSHSID